MAQIQPPTSNFITQGRHGNYNAVDYAARTSKFIPVMNNKNIYAVADGKITAVGPDGNMGNRVHLTTSTHRWGFGHMESIAVNVGQQVKRGQLLGVMGHTGLTIPAGYYGTHLHLVALELATGEYIYPPTLMNMPFSVYTPAPPATAPAGMPRIGSTVLFQKGYPRTTFKAGTTTQAGILNPDGKGTHIVRGYDPKFPNRIIINSASAGGNGVAIALYLTNWTKIAGWVAK